MSTTTSPRVAIVTGGTRGIGRSIAEALTDQGYAVVVTYTRDEASASATLAALTSHGGDARAVRADVADEHEIEALFDETERQFGGVDVVVNAAGVMPVAPLVDLDLADLDRVLRTNVRGTVVVNQQAARRLRAGGAIINLSSSVTRGSNPGNTAYTASKGAVEALTLVVARELRGRDITVNAVAPGAIATDMLEEFFAAQPDSDAARARVESLSPLERLGLPTDISAVVTFLAGPGRWINGQVIFVNGGAV
jgi:3-oxoacyl-[acyl-carrier protein] reductase